MQQVRSEAKKVHDLFFDIIGVAFSDTDFREARSSMSFTAPVSTPATGPSSRQFPSAQGKRQKSVKDVDSENTPFPKTQTRTPIHTVESSKARNLMPHKDSRLGSSSSRDLGQPDDARPFTHPGDLVICKKKRKDREKSGTKSGNGSAGPLSPTGIGRVMKSPGSVSGAKDIGSSQHGWGPLSPQQGNSSGGSVGWANPVKRMRTDAGRRRPSHL